MLKVVSRASGVGRKERSKLVQTRERARALYQQVDEQRALVSCTQRAVARGRRTVVEAHCRVLRFAERPPGSPASAGDQALTKLAGRLDNTHQRLLQFSTSVEMEMDRLDITRAEIERLTNGTHDLGDQPATTRARRRAGGRTLVTG